MLISVTNLRKVYSSGDEVEVVALKDADLTIEHGEFVAIMGPSGSGKSTLMHIFGCLDQPTEGTYLFDGIDVGGLSDDKLAEIRNKKIGFVFQQFNLLPRTSALDNVILPLLYNREFIDREKARLALDRVGLSERYHHHPSQLSGGQQQRVAIARALVTKPTLIMADEPTGALDTKSGDEIMAIFQELNEEGKTIILVTHELYIAEHAKRVIFLKDGEIVSDKRLKNRKISKVAGVMA